MTFPGIAKAMSEQLYIPFWLYSNLMDCNCNRCGCCFTFHSGYILIIKSLRNATSKIYFTFHSGYILIKLSRKRHKNYSSLYIPFWLYSNIVPVRIESFSYNFTFHSGYILIAGVCVCSRSDQCFTFHSGYILMRLRHLRITKTLNFTFHSGYILMTQ